MRPDTRHLCTFALALAGALLWAAPAAATPLPGDLDGDGSVGAADEALLASVYGSAAGDPDYDAGGDLDGDGAIDVTDLALFGAAYGSTGGTVDATPPTLFVTLNDIPDAMNDLLVVPPNGFRITIAFDSAGGSVIDPDSLAVTGSEDTGVAPAGQDFADLFQVTQSGASFEIPAGPGGDFPFANHYLDVSVRDAAGNEATAAYGFAVRPFAFGAPMGSLQVMFLDFDQDRSLGPEVDFLEDLREYGLSSTADPVLESAVRDALVAEIVGRVSGYYGLAFDGTPGPDAVNIAFTATAPGGSHSRLCVGGESVLGSSFLGSSVLDVHNLNETQDDCGAGTQFGVFPQALDNLWGGNAEFQAAFGPLDPDLGGTPVGEDPLDPSVLDPDFDPGTATAAELDRLAEIADGLDAFAQVLASAIAHETGHYLGLTAPGPTPAGLFGGESGGSQDHNVTPAGGTPSENFLMNAGASFTFDEMIGRNGFPLPFFRPLSWAYLRDRVALNDKVTGLFPPPVLDSIDPNPVVFEGQSATLAFHGDGFLAQPVIELDGPGVQVPIDVTNITVVDPQTVTGTINKLLVPEGTYDIHFVNGDGQEITLPAFLVVGQP